VGNALPSAQHCAGVVAHVPLERAFVAIGLGPWHNRPGKESTLKMQTPIPSRNATSGQKISVLSGTQSLPT
jgi:hypothetical protein